MKHSIESKVVWNIHVSTQHLSSNMGRWGYVMAVRSLFVKHGFTIIQLPENADSYSHYHVSHVSEHAMTLFLLSNNFDGVSIERLV